jgi:hypothetical protein
MHFYRSLMLFVILALPAVAGLSSCGYRIVNRLM